MRRLVPIIGLAAALAVGATAYAQGSARSVPKGFRPETAAAIGSRDLWVEGEYRCGGTWCLALARSTDGGARFVRLSFPPFPSQGAVPAIVFANAQDGFAYEGALYATHDGGETWHREVSGGVLAFTVGGGNAFVFIRRHGLERTPVARDAWRLVLPLKTQYPIGLAARGSGLWLLGPPWRRAGVDTIRLSADHGRTFAARKGPCFPQFDGRLAAAAGGVVWAVCPSGMMAGLSLSTNGGRTFSIRSFHDPGGLRKPSLTNAAQIAPASARVAVLSGGGGGGALLRTTDSGRHWSSVPRTAGIQQVFWLGFTTARVGAAVVQARGNGYSLWLTTDAGASWHAVPVH